MTFTFPTYQVVFYVFAALLVGSALMVVLTRNPVRSALFLVLSFFTSSVLWMMLQAEFLSLVLIFVYVGAVMTLFLFVIMMLNPDLSAMKARFVRYLPVVLLIFLAFVGLMYVMLEPSQLLSANAQLPNYGPNYSNVTAMGTLLFTRYLYPFELAAAILLVSIIAAIALAFHGKRPNTKSQRIAEQHLVTKADRLKIIKMESDKS